MNVAIDGRYRRRGVATALIEHLFAQTDRGGERYTLEVRVSNSRRSGCTSRSDSERGHQASLLPRQQRGRSDHVAHAPRRYLGIETSCDDTCAAVVTAAEGEILSSAISSQSRFHERYGGVVPEVASRHHLELVNAVVEDALGMRIRGSMG